MSKILVVDDNEQNLYLLETLLGASGYEVATAADGTEALEEALRDPPTLIVSDILMPVMDGFALCRRWKTDEQLKQIPFVFYTATYTDSQDEEFALKLGADRFVRKPAEPDAFLATMREVLEKRDKGELSNVTPPEVTEDIHLREYNQVLLRKLEDKMEQLEQANLLLEQRVANRTSELEERNQTLEAFSYSVAHDLGAPLRGIRGFAEILVEDEQDRLSDEGKNNLEVIIQASDRLQQMMSDLLRYATMGRGGLGMCPVPLSSVMHRIKSDLAGRLTETKANLIIPEDLPTVIGEATLLNQVFLNLIRNALTYCKAGETPHVEVTFETVADRVTVAVRDQGIGIRTDDCQQIFTLFTRLHSSEEYTGSGVGLGIVERAVRMLGGSVRVESEVGQGSTFYVELRRATTDAT